MNQTFRRGYQLIDEVAGMDELHRELERAAPETRLGVIARALEDLLATDDTTLGEHIHNALFATPLRKQLPMPVDWKRDDPRFVRFAELWLCVYSPVLDADLLVRTLTTALDTTWEPMFEALGASPEQRYGGLLYELVSRLIREPQTGTATLLARLAERAPSIYRYPAENAANRAAAESRPRHGRTRASERLAALWSRLTGSGAHEPGDARRPASSSATSVDDPVSSSSGGPYRAGRPGAFVERPRIAGPVAWTKLAGVRERGALRSLRADPGPLLDQWSEITAHATLPAAGCYCTRLPTQPDTIVAAPCGMRAIRELDDGAATSVLLECPRTRLRWIRHEVPALPDGTYGQHRPLGARVDVRADDTTQFLELAYVVKDWIERPEAVVERLNEAWERAGRPPAELPTDCKKR